MSTPLSKPGFHLQLIASFFKVYSAPPGHGFPATLCCFSEKFHQELGMLPPIAMLTTFSKSRLTFGFRLSRLLGLVSLFALGCSARATDGTWNVNASGTWTTGTNWVGGTIATGTSALADLTTVNLSGARTISIDGAAAQITVGVLNIGDTNATSSYIVTGSTTTPGTLILDNGASNARITEALGSFGDTIAVPLRLNSSLDLNNSGTIGRALLISGSISSNTAGLKTISNVGTGTGAVTISGIIADGSGTVAIVQNSSASTMTLTGTNTFTGGISVLSGTLVASATNNSFGATSNVITLGAASGTANAAVGAMVTGTVAQAINVVGGSTNNTLTIGHFGTVNTVGFSGSISLLNHDVILANNASSSGAVTFTGGVTGTGNILVNNSGTSGSLTISTTAINTVGNLTLNALRNSIITVSAPVSVTGTIVNSGTGTGVVTISGPIASAAGVVQTSTSSQLTLSGSNAFTGALSVLSGSVQLNSVNAMRSASALILGGTTGSAFASLFASISGTYSQAITVSGGSSGNIFTLGNNGSSAPILFSGSTRLLNHDLVLSNNSSTTGSLTFSGGFSGTGNIVANNSGTSGALAFSTNGINTVGNLTLNTLSSGTLVVSAPVAITGTVTNSGTGTGATTISGTIGSSVAAVVQSASSSQLTLSGNNAAFAGGVTILSGTVSAINSVNALGTGTATLGDTSGSANATLLGDTRTFTNAINVRSGNTGLMTIGNSGNNSVVFSALISLNKDLSINANGTGSVNLSAAVGGSALSGTGSITINSATPASNTVTLSGSNSGFTGNVLVNSGSFRVGSANALSSANTVAVNSGTTSFNLFDNNQTIAGLNDGAGGGGLVTNSSGNVRTLTLGGSGTYAFSGSLAAATSANLALTKTGTGQQTFTGDSTYTGATNITAGTLIVGVNGVGSLGNTAVTVGASATLGGSGTIGGAVTVSGTLAPGNSPGTLTINNSLILNSSASTLIELGGSLTSEYDRVIGITNFTLDGVITVSLVNAYTPGFGDSFDLFDWSGVLTSSGFIVGTDLILPTLGGGKTWDTTNFLTNGTIAVVPEPSTVALAALGCAGMLLLRRRVRA